MHPELSLDSTTLAAFCRNRGIRKLSLFGSRIRGTARPDSDLDLLVEFGPDSHPTLFDLAAMESDLSTLLGGRRVDLRTPGLFDVGREVPPQQDAPGRSAGGRRIIARSRVPMQPEHFWPEDDGFPEIP